MNKKLDQELLNLDWENTSISAVINLIVGSRPFTVGVLSNEKRISLLRLHKNHDFEELVRSLKEEFHFKATAWDGSPETIYRPSQMKSDIETILGLCLGYDASHEIISFLKARKWMNELNWMIESIITNYNAGFESYVSLVESINALLAEIESRILDHQFHTVDQGY